MTKLQNKLIAIAKGEVGYLEKATTSNLEDKTANAGYNNFTKYGAWYGDNGVFWCAQFVSWCIAQAGVDGPRYEGCYAGKQWFANRGLWHNRDGYIPQPGDVIFFSSKSYPYGGAHTGIVTGCDGNIVRTVEGNTSSTYGVVPNGGCVCEKAYYLNYEPIFGYGTPNWPEEVEEEQEANDYMTKAQILEELGDQWIDSYEDLPEWAKPTMREILDRQIINGGTDYATNPDDIKMFLSDIKTIIAMKRLIPEV